MTSQSSAFILEQIIDGCRRNDALSQELLYKRFYGYAMSVCMRYTQNTEDAAEVLNDGFVKIFKNIASFDPSKPFKTWLCRIMINTAISHHRHFKKYDFHEEINKIDQADTAPTALNDFNYEDLRNMVEQLPLGYRTVFKLYAIDGYSHEEITQLLGISIGTSKSNLSRARELLRKKLMTMNYER